MHSAKERMVIKGQNKYGYNIRKKNKERKKKKNTHEH